MKKILVVEDEATIREFIVINLNRAGYKTIEAANGEEGLKTFKENNGNFHVALIDIMMPVMDGLQLCKELRKLSTNLGIIILTARTQEMDKVTGLMVGADDYVTKPFSPSELVARVDSLCRRVTLSEQQTDVMSLSDEIIHGEYTLNLRRRQLLRNGVAVELTQVEFQIVEYFFQHPNTVISRSDILSKVWGEGYFGEEKVVDVNVRRLRMKLEDKPSMPVHLQTVWGAGYQWVT